ncbi:MAG: AzlC family ABC transporter permease [Arenicellales bacterium]|jgi:predicted branched-subunit amino acid permease|nr:branched-chain amino acid ABC transporter permease [Gammaproteobacteria bacterium]NDA15272.1 branched-chain amino acid ABC transporter permease [Gammaproteobacteria bacterium]NDG44705.1 branched-chain amino acid ABC transporter permease [Gammaproteobacteria bacterium]
MTRQRARVGMIVDPSEVSRLACRDAISFPAFTLLFSMIGFGSLVHQSDLPLLMAVALTAGIWGLPGQLTLVEMHVAGASLFFVVLGVALANARFLPMVVSFMPLMPSRSSNVASRFVLAQMLSINSWAAGLRRFPDITPELRRRYYVLFGVICMGSGVLGTVIGFVTVKLVPHEIALGLIFMNPLFFAVLLAGVTSRSAVTALLVGAPLGLFFHAIAPDLDLLLTGAVGGTLAFLIDRRGRSKAL